MIKVYANLIQKGLKTIDEVPQKLKQAVLDFLSENESVGV